MCGIYCEAGNLAKHSNVLVALDRMKSRGPDSSRVASFPNAYLGHCRLSIIDLTDKALQPMNSRCGNFTIVFNGEIYNYLDLKKSMLLDGIKFNTNSDTEVLLEGIVRYGIGFIKKIRGMFSFVMYDISNEMLTFGRDPYGIKPLYYALFNNTIAISSTVKAILTAHDSLGRNCILSQSGFELMGVVQDPSTAFEAINSVPPGFCYEYTLFDSSLSKHCVQTIDNLWLHQSKTKDLTRTELHDVVKKAVYASIGYHLVSDVEVGIFLSGGIDSSVIASIASEISNSNLWGITVCFDEFSGTDHDELPLAKTVADKYNMRFYERRVRKEEFFTDIPRILKDMDQPTIDGINTWYAAKAANELGLKVVLSGVGGDELFFGYDTFIKFEKIYSANKLMKKLGTKRIARFLGSIIGRLTKNKKLPLVFSCGDNILMCWLLIRSIQPSIESLSEKFKQDIINIDTFNNLTARIPFSSEYVLTYLESKIYMMNQLLRDSDWASMSHSVELRTPFVDYFFAETLVPYLKSIKRNGGKRLLASVPNTSIPEQIIYRQKTGFATPIVSWLREYFKLPNSMPDAYVIKKFARESLNAI